MGCRLMFLWYVDSSVEGLKISRFTSQNPITINCQCITISAPNFNQQINNFRLAQNITLSVLLCHLSSQQFLHMNQ